jgi:ketosteroid isomerase-like protein
MRSLAAFLSLVSLLMLGLAPARAGDAAVVEAINKAAAALDQAFERQDAEAIKKMMTPDHIAVTPFYHGPQTVADQLASLPELKYEQKIDGKPAVAVLGPDAATRRFTAEFNGSFEGNSIQGKVYVNEIWVKGDAAWREKFYQVTALKP